MIYGAGGHGKVVADALVSSGKVVLGFIDDSPARAGSSVLNLPVFAAQEWLRSHAPADVALGIGDNRAREQAAARVKHCGCTLFTVVHPSAVVAKTARIAEGVAIMAASVLNADCEIDEGTIINTGAIVEHDVHVGRYAHLAPRSTAAGNATVGAYSLIGMGANVLPSKKLGANCIVGAGAVVMNDVPAGCTVSGVPARSHTGTGK